MGAWGEGPFDNDDAGDWAYELDDVDASAGLQVVTQGLQLAATTDYLEAPDGTVAVAAATVVSWLANPASIPDSPYGESAATWVRTSGATASDDLKAAARAALTRVRGDESELAELWAEAGDDDWLAALAQIEVALV